MTRRVQIDHWLAAPAGWRAIALTLGVLLAICVLPILVSPGIYVSVMLHDTVAMADIGYRLAQGQRPGRDFHSAFGVLYQWQVGLAWTLAPSVAGAMKMSTLIFAITVCGLGGYVARTRLTNLGAVWVLAAILLLGAVPFAEADAILIGVSYAMMYNREAWIFLLLALLYWLPVRRAVAPAVEGLTLGALLCLCVYFKLSYGGMALAFCGLWAAYRPAGRRPVVIALATLAVFALLLDLIYGLGFNAIYLSDILLVGRSGGARLAHIIVNLFSARAELIVACALIPLIAAHGRRIDRYDRTFILFSATAALLIVWQNAQVEGLVTLWAAVALALEAPLKDESGPSGAIVWRTAAAWPAWGVMTLAPIGLALIQAILGAWTAPLSNPQVAAMANVRFTAPAAKNRPTDPGLFGYDYPSEIDDGLALLRACPTGATLATLDQFEPFTMLQHRAPNHGWTWRHFGHSFSIPNHPDPSREFAGVGCIMIPKEPTDPPTTAALLALYTPYLDAKFRNAQESRDWILRLRTKN